MAHARFDPSHAVRFDLSRGQVKLDGREDRLLLPSEVVLELWREASDEAKKSFGHRLGSEIGRRVAGRLGAVAGSSIAAVVEHLGGDLALAGLGSFSVERWGRALVLRMSPLPRRYGRRSTRSSRRARSPTQRPRRSRWRPEAGGIRNSGITPAAQARQSRAERRARPPACARATARDPAARIATRSWGASRSART